MILATQLDPLVTRIDPRQRRQRSRREARLRQARHGAELIAACGTGAAIAYLLDPGAGRRRRHMLRDRTLAIGRRRARSAARRASYEAGHLHGAAHRAGGLVHHETPDYDDVTLTQRVESAISKAHAVPKGTVIVNARRGVIELRGAVVSEDQIEAIGKAARDVAGVRSVENLLHIRGTAIPHAQPARAHGVDHG
ncbi:MAG TPA: BON domain-containing protein [Conexibacter sp.]|jgi:hypothetical protein